MEKIEKQSDKTCVDIFSRLINEKFRDLSDIQIAEFRQIARIREFATDCILVDEQSGGDIVGGVISGILRVQKYTEDGKSHVIDFRLPGSSFGRIFADRSNVSVEAATDVVVWIAERSALEHLSERHPIFLKLFFEEVLEDLDSTRRQILFLGSTDLNERLARFLLLNLDKSAKASTKRVRLPVNRKDMAHYLGTTVESISRFMASMEADGVIEFRDRKTIMVHDLGRLVQIAGEEFGGLAEA